MVSGPLVPLAAARLIRCGVRAAGSVSGSLSGEVPNSLSDLWLSARPSSCGPACMVRDECQPDLSADPHRSRTVWSERLSFETQAIDRTRGF